MLSISPEVMFYYFFKSFGISFGILIAFIIGAGLVHFIFGGSGTER